MVSIHSDTKLMCEAVIKEKKRSVYTKEEYIKKARFESGDRSRDR